VRQAAIGWRVGVLLQLQEIVTYYGAIRILKGVSLHVGEGEVVGLLGGNAAGKSTTMKTILGLVTPSAGTVRFSGQDVTRESPGQRVARGMAAVPEARRLFPSMSVYDNLLMGAYSRRKSRWSEIRRELALILELFPRIAERLRQNAGTLSGGEQQMVAVGRALMARPKLILMDEPSMGLAPSLVEKVYEIIGQIKALGTSMLIVEQNATMALSLANRAYVLQNGEIVTEGSGQQLLQSEAIRKAYLGGRH
jgi:branched-chain amino acid transport system ATP-binding protein